jgi:hypothetical protein
MVQAEKQYLDTVSRSDTFVVAIFDCRRRAYRKGKANTSTYFLKAHPEL